MSIHTILSQEMEKFDKKFVWHPSGGGEYWYHTGNPTEAKQWIKSFATRIVEEVGKELIDKNEEGFINAADHPIQFGYTNGRNNLRSEMRTKLQKMKI